MTEKKYVQLEGVKFYLSKMRTAYQEKALHIALRNCSKEMREMVNIYDFGEGRVHALKHIFLQAPLLMS